MNKVIYILSFLLIISCNTRKSEDNYNFTTKIDSLLQSNKPRNFSGVVLVAKNGEILYNKAFGYSDFESKTLLKNTDHLSTMSIAKQITATLVLQQVEKGLIDINAPINQYLKDIPFSWASKVKVHHLLNNSSGIDAWELKEKLLFEPGTDFKYSNIGYATLGRILEKTTGKTYESLVSELFKNVGMNDSFYPNSTSNKLLVNSYFASKNSGFQKVEKFPFEKNLFPGSHLITTTEDLSKWNNALHGGKLLNKENYQKMISYSVTNQHDLFSSEKIGYGFGLRINDKAKNVEYGHTGFSPVAGYTAVNLYYPKEKVTIIVIENTATDNFDIAYYYESEVRKIILNSKLLN